MDTISTVLFFVGLLVRVSIAVTSSSLEGVNPLMASIVVKEGEPAEISCTMKESNVAYFWKRGGSLENSTDVASFIEGITTNNPDQPYTATENGTLIIKKVSLNDEGKYICRVTSEEISCHGEVIVFVQAALQDFQLTIEYCKPENSCLISTESTKPTSLTCKATNASPSMKLKWFNGSREIKENIEENSLTKKTLREISSTIKDVYKVPSTLTCQAVDFKTSNDDGMFAHVQFRTPATADISPGWTVTAILFIVGFVILFVIIIYITVWSKTRKGKDIKTQKSAEQESLLRKENELKEQREQILKLEKALVETNADKQVKESKLTSKDTELKEKCKEISKLETDLRSKGDEMKTLSEEINNLKDALMETNADKRVNESNVTSKDKELHDKRQQIMNLEKSLETVKGDLSKINKEHQTQKDNLTQKELQIQKLQSELQHVKEPLTKIQKREQEISSKEKVMIKREICVKKLEDDVNTKEAMLNDRDTEITRREDAVIAKESSLKKHEDSLNSKESKLTEQETDIKKQLLDLEKERRICRLDQMASKDPIRINCRLIASRTGDDARVATKERGGQAKVKAKNKWDFSPKDAKFHTIYQAGAEPRDLCQSIVDLIENAIDGKNSCIISHGVSGREHWTTMFGPGKGTSDALVPYAITKIFKRSKELRSLDYKVDVTARFQITSTESTNFESVKDEKIAFELLKKNKGNIVQVDGTTDHFVQFFITTETHDQETLTGTLILATIGSIQMIKECFLSEEPKTQLTQNMSAIISDGRCRSVLLTHIHEDKLDESKDCLKMVNEISKKNKK